MNIFKRKIPEEVSPKPEKNRTIQEMVNEVVSFATSQENVAKLNAVERGMNTRDDYLAGLRSYVMEHYGLQEDPETLDKVMDGFTRFMWSYYILDDLIDDRDISDIKLIAYDQIYYKRNGKRELSDIRFIDERDYDRFVERVAIKNHINISEQNAIQVFTDKSQPGWRLRFNLSSKFITNTGSNYIHIRKQPEVKYKIEDLIRQGMLTQRQAEHLIKKVRNRESILLCGSGGSGKTTLLNALIEYFEGRSVYCIQESDELHPEKKMEFMSYHTVMNKGEGKLRYSLSDLAPNGLLTDTDIFILGEIKGAEALDFLIAVHTGAAGYGSVHAPSEEDAYIRLADYIKKVSDYSIDEILYMLRYLSTCVFMKDYRCASISSVEWDDSQRKLIFRKENPDGKC